uniref:EF-hand domain-containing protein n=1 Tax=Pyramimonas obovata TaxID=1411642 RepID=A0A7S0N545_9CHLO|mmetsp:Transcript_20941/g.45925  ORF Transcript_20941/g.45925 Transcript_20941/m.45925 type:complete len:450 (+) Transcript_20941:270-1619(+)|eukprot:CAMPEP_0118939758 /NCGR_PEP_ID=MMETSP1169-20130426/29713_1 /TAXON_ID=36882 /ORGANISM="Pyramimonas obovata, Strain CCMP722" /LENGTH=449 /DNA_ID=CAMNT_0006884095 /DNA_START=203 /DNA_END=1552 /DNA_ORIENTATION=+
MSYDSNAFESALDDALGPEPARWTEEEAPGQRRKIYDEAPESLADLLDDYEEYEERMRAIFTVFLSFDADQSGALSKAELSLLLKKSKMMEGVKDEIQNKFFQDLYTDSHGKEKEEIDFQEYTKFHNAVIGWRRRESLEPIDVKAFADRLLVSATTKKLQNETGSKRDKTKPRSLGSAEMQGRRRQEKLSNLATREQNRKAREVGDAGLALKLVLLFKKADKLKVGHISPDELFKTMQMEGWLTTKQDVRFGQGAQEKFLARYGISDITLTKLVQLMLPEKPIGKILTLIDEARKYLRRSVSMDRREQEFFKLRDEIKFMRVDLEDEELVEILSIFSSADLNSDRELSYEEFSNTLASIYSTLDLREIFDAIDIDKSGTVGVWEFVAFWTLGIDHRMELTNDFSKHLMGMVDQAPDIAVTIADRLSMKHRKISMAKEKTVLAVARGDHH